MKILLIGGTGAIGQGLLALLTKYEVTVCNSKDIPLPLIRNFFQHDIVINLAGIITDCELSEHNIINKKLIEVNCLGAVNILLMAIPYMKEQKYGRIIFMSSIFSKINVKRYGVYSASKAFVDKLVKIAALENAEFGITVNSIQLGYAGIGMGDHPDKDKSIQKSALKRFCTMQELYNAIEFIISTEYYTGQNLELEGGIK